MANEKLDIHADVTDRIITAIESGALPWRKDWKNNAASGLPTRANGQLYKGVNVLLLWIASAAGGFNADLWMTFKQAQTEGACVRKGEKGTRIVFTAPVVKKDKATGEDNKFFISRYYTVFNADQIDGLSAERTAKPESIDTGARGIADLDAFFAGLPMTLRHGGNRAFYSATGDFVQMPAIQQFESAFAYYGTLAHEAIHWTSHESRCDRDLSQKKAEYAFEELIAELGACFLTSTIGGQPDLNNSAAYVQSWLAALKNDKRFIFSAASKASAASNYLIEQAGKGADAMPDTLAQAA